MNLSIRVYDYVYDSDYDSDYAYAYSYNDSSSRFDDRQPDARIESSVPAPLPVPVPVPVVFETRFKGNVSKLATFSMYRDRIKCETNSAFYRPPSNFVARALSQLKKGPAAGTTGNDKAAVCIMQKDEDRLLQEWINYHLAIGFHDIYLFNDGNPMSNSTIRSTKHLHVFTIDQWGARRIHKQSAIYHACVEIIRSRQPIYNTSWVAFMDIDEFLVLKRHKLVTNFMEEHCPETLCGSVGINWLWFGTSNQTFYSNDPVTQRFTYRAKEPVLTIKSITRLSAFHCATNAHFVHLTSDPLQQSPHSPQPPFPYDTRGYINFRGPTTSLPDMDHAVIHHYTMSLEEWFVRRCIRGDVHRSHNLKCTGRYPEAGTVHDLSAFKFYQTNVLDRMDEDNDIFLKSMPTPKWKLYPESSFGIKEIVPLSNIFDLLNP